jgi:hypothetical protein
MADPGAHKATFRTDVVFEYDGLALVTLTCDKPQALPLEGLTIEIPVKNEHAIYQHRYLTS